MALQNLEFKQKVSGDYIHYESEPVQLTGDCGIQLLFKGDKKDDTDEYLRMTVDGVNVALEMYNATRDLTAGAQPAVDEAEGNNTVKELSAALKSSDDSAKADALVKVRAFIAQFKDCAEAVCK